MLCQLPPVGRVLLLRLERTPTGLALSRNLLVQMRWTLLPSKARLLLVSSSVGEGDCAHVGMNDRIAWSESLHPPSMR